MNSIGIIQDDFQIYNIRAVLNTSRAVIGPGVLALTEMWQQAADTQGSLLGLILTHEGAKKAISCIDFKYFKILNEGGNAELCVTAFINKS